MQRQTLPLDLAPASSSATLQRTTAAGTLLARKRALLSRPGAVCRVGGESYFLCDDDYRVFLSERSLSAPVHWPMHGVPHDLRPICATA